MRWSKFFVTALVAHRQWADLGALVSVIAIIGGLSIATFLTEATDASEASRLHLYLVVVGSIIAVCVWQAAAFVAAALEQAIAHYVQAASKPES